MKTTMRTRPVNKNHRKGPAYNIKNKDEYVLIEMAVPGYTKDAINLSMEKGMLRIHSSGVEEADNGYVTKQFTMDPFQLEFTLGKTLDPESIEASLDHGMLKVKIMKREEIIALEKKRTIPVS